MFARFLTLKWQDDIFRRVSREPLKVELTRKQRVPQFTARIIARSLDQSFQLLSSVGKHAGCSIRGSMRLRLIVILLYSVALIGFAAGSFKSFAFSFGSDATTIQQPKPVLGLGLDGKRGLVLFHHNPHESQDRIADFTPPFLNKPAGGLSCVVCHHRRDTTDPSKADVTDITDIKQFQKCSNCHRPEGDARNFYDAEGYELSNREASHRLCVACHMTKGDLASKGLYRAAEKIPLKCGDCHDREGAFAARTDVIPQPPAERPRRIFDSEPPVVRVAPFPTPVDSPPGYAGPSRIENPKQETA